MFFFETQCIFARSALTVTPSEKSSFSTGFRLAPTSMTLNDLERRNSPYFAFFTNSIDLQADYVSGRR